ncbi:MAG TPA: SIR2 family protein [Allosphingosinicella sp.]|nr:SIR2 family protein [Allosphingosinicella sp.]
MRILKNTLSQEDTIIFVGSGLSLWSGLPSWHDLIDNLAVLLEDTGLDASVVRAEARRGDLLQAASYGFDKLTKPQIGEFIRSQCKLGTARPAAIHEKVVKLGPRCFITTNYDDLVEQSLRKWHPDRFYRPAITNRHLSETGEIISARSTDFIFKPHGDAADSDSIILTREQYRQLLPQGDRAAALDALKTLMVTRPIVYIGFGLRDPDFLYLRDILANTYKGSMRDHFAIMPDLSPEEIDHWRRHYGIHLVSYETKPSPDGGRDHSALLSLLDGLLEPELPEPSDSAPPPGPDPKSSDMLFALTRYCSGLTRVSRAEREFQIRVTSEQRAQPGRPFAGADPYHFAPVEKLLTQGPPRAILVGMPGAGKSYSMHMAAAAMAEAAQADCLSENPDLNTPVPVIADFKFYRGSLLALIDETLPPALPFTILTQTRPVRVFLDSFNEMPREFWENAAYSGDLQDFLKTFGGVELVIGSRSDDGLRDLGIPVYNLDHIDDKDVLAEVTRLGLDIRGPFRSDFLRLLSRPFFLQMVATKGVALGTSPRPQDLYHGYFGNVQSEWDRRFSDPLNLVSVLSACAFGALNAGEEAFPAAELMRVLRQALDASPAATDPQDAVNWLIARSVILPRTGGRVTFVHQSITEYLAATEFVRRYEAEPAALEEKLALRRWDQALFLTLSLLPAEKSDDFIDRLTAADLLLALNAVKYVDGPTDELVERLLRTVLSKYDEEGRPDFLITHAIEGSLPLAPRHEPLLKEMLGRGGALGAAAAKGLAAMKGREIKAELLNILAANPTDFNLTSGILRTLAPFVDPPDVEILGRWVEELEELHEHDDEDVSGIQYGFSKLFADLDVDTVLEGFLRGRGLHEISSTVAKSIANAVENRTDGKEIKIAADLIAAKHGEEGAEIIFFSKQAKNSTTKQEWDLFNSDHLRALIVAIKDNGGWSPMALSKICEHRPELRSQVVELAEDESEWVRAVLVHLAGGSGESNLFSLLQGIVEMPADERRHIPYGLLTPVALNWAGHEDLYVSLLQLRDPKLRDYLLGPGLPVTVRGLGSLPLGDLAQWFQWMLDLAGEEKNNLWEISRFGSLLGTYSGEEACRGFIDEFCKSDSRWRPLIGRFILPYAPSVSSDDLSEDAISYLLADLSREDAITALEGHLLGKCATERFVVERLVPLAAGAEGVFLKNLRAVLENAGARHGRRYLV